MNGGRNAERPTTARSARTGPFMASGALVSAIASSACCWLPLLLLAFGASAAGLSAWFERYRFPFLIAAGLMLAFSFYSVYFRVRRCEPGSACGTITPASRRVTRSLLWISTVLIIAFAAFPKYVGTLLPDDRHATGADLNDPRAVNYIIEGMTCEACAVTLARELRSVNGILDASVSYSDHSAVVVFDADASGAPSRFVQAARTLGYTARMREASRLPRTTAR